jgi:hypothetical protein
VSINALGGDGVVAENIIAGNTENGISVINQFGGSTLISRNQIFANLGLGIDVSAADGVTANDDPDANGIQNFPVLTSAKRKGDTTKVAGKLNSKPELDYKIEFFEADGKTRQGKRFIDDKKVTTDEDGEAKVKANLPKPRKGKFIVATATDTAEGTDGNTSEYSKPRKVK